MIRAEKGMVELNGEAYDIVFELMHLLKQIIKKNPELITGVLAVYTDELHNAVKTANPYGCSVITRLALTIKEDLQDD